MHRRGADEVGAVMSMDECTSLKSLIFSLLYMLSLNGLQFHYTLEISTKVKPHFSDMDEMYSSQCALLWPFWSGLCYLFIFAVVVSAEMNCSPLLISVLLRVQAHQGVHFNKGIFDEY